MATYPLMDSYLVELGRHLPRGVRDDMVADGQRLRAERRTVLMSKKCCAYWGIW